MKKKIIQETFNTVIDSDGVILESVKNTVSYVDREPDYVKLYLADIMRLNDLPKSSNNILFAILRRMDYDNEVVLISHKKKQLSEELNISEETVKKAIELFVEKSILIRSGRGVYIINPFFVGRGKWEEIRKIRLTIDYSPSGRMILKTQFSRNEIEQFEEQKISNYSESFQ